MADRPPLDQRSRRRLARTGIPQIVRRNRVDQPVTDPLPIVASLDQTVQTGDAVEVRAEDKDASATDVTVFSSRAEAANLPRAATYTSLNQGETRQRTQPQSALIHPAPSILLNLPPFSQPLKTYSTESKKVQVKQHTTTIHPDLSSSESSNEDSDGANHAIAADVVVPTYGAELAKRARPDTSSSGSEGQEDKRVKLSHALALPSAPGPTVIPRPESPVRSFSPSKVLPTPSGPGLTQPITVPSVAFTHLTENLEPPGSTSTQLMADESASWPKDSTSYAGLASPTSRSMPMDVSRRTSPQPSSSYAAAAAASIAPRNSPPPAATTATEPQPPPRSCYPPLVVECLPNWTRHFEALRQELGHAPSARPFGKGVRFLPKSVEEFRVVQRYLMRATNQDATISWFCYSPETERPTKVAIRGLPWNTSTEEVISALRSLGFPAENSRAIPPPSGKNGCTYFVQLAHLNQEELRDLYSVVELLNMTDITVEAWRGLNKPPQCHRCQAFGHASANCHRPQRCLRCAGEHPIRDCLRSREDTPTCANCGKEHAANDRRCVLYKREARRRGIALPPVPPRAHQRPQQQWRRRGEDYSPTHLPTAHPTTQRPTNATQNTCPVGLQYDATEGPTTLAPPANPPTGRRQTLRKKKKKRSRVARPLHSEPAASSTPHVRQTKEAEIPAHAPTETAAHVPIQAANQNNTQTWAHTQMTAQQPSPSPTQMPTQVATEATTERPVQQPVQVSTQAQRPTHPPVQRPSQYQTQRPTQAPTHVSPLTNQDQGEARPNSDVTAIVRVVLEALMAGLATYLQGQGIKPAIAAGMAALTHLHSI